MTPYFEDSRYGITIYHGRCEDLLPQLSKADLVLTDPPYGIARSGQPETFTKLAKHKRKYHEDFGWDSKRPSLETFQLIQNASEIQIIWGGNYFADLLPPSMCWLYWDKGQNGLSMSDGELAWTSMQKALRAYTCNRFSLIGSTHPTEKPMALINWCIRQADKAASLIDPFMGSGTTLLAAKNLNRRAIGIEVEERYCEIAARRLSVPSLFDELVEPQRSIMEQDSLFSNAS